MGNIKLYNGNCLDVMKDIPDGSIDLIVTDPPYKTISGGNKSKWASGYPNSVLSKNDGKIFEQNDINHLDWLKESYRVLKNSSHIYIMTNLLNLFTIQQLAERVGFKTHNLLVWEKNNANANRWYMKNCEYVLFMRKGNAKTINDPSSKTVHKFNNIIGNKIHPTEKPVELMELYILNSSKEGETVLDPFMGGGSIILAAIKNNRIGIGIEKDEEYFKIAEQRINARKLFSKTFL